MFCYQQLIIKNHLINYPTPINFNYFWSFGALSGLLLTLQIISGIFLAMHYIPHILLAFNSVEHIMRDVNYGWLFRYLHSNGASFFFILVYLHIGKGLYYNSFLPPYVTLWRIGIIIFILMMLTAFIGYVLPWGQMSFWGATVITNLFTAIPLIGKDLVIWIWGGYAIENPTLRKLFSLHYFLPFIITGFVVLHLILLHIPGSSEPLKFFFSVDKISFYPYFYVKDLFSFFILLFIFSIFLFFFPNYLGHFDNYIEANVLSTPAHIVPEWYFLPFYAILRSIPNKLGGVLAMGLALIILLVIKNFTNIKSEISFGRVVTPSFRPLHKIFFWLFCYVLGILGWIGAKPVEYPYVDIGFIATIAYFAYFLFIIKFCFIFDYQYFVKIAKATKLKK